VLADPGGGGNGVSSSGGDAEASSSSTLAAIPEPPVQVDTKPNLNAGRIVLTDDFATVHHVTRPVMRVPPEEGEQQLREEKGDEGSSGDSAQETADAPAAIEDGQRNSGDDDMERSSDAATAEEPIMASEVLHDDSLSSIPPLPSDWDDVKLAAIVNAVGQQLEAVSYTHLRAHET